MSNAFGDIGIIYKDKNFLAINKPAGILVQKAPGAGHREAEAPTIVDWLLENYPEVKTVGDKPEERPGIVHRLDRETSGVMLVARNQETFDYLKSQFQERKVQKTYWALVFGNVKDSSGRIELPIGIKSGTTKRTVFAKKMKMIKEAVTDYEVIKYLKIGGEDFTLLKVLPRTGRTHQIRVHLTAIGHPIMGDKLYGGKRNQLAGLDRQFLHAQSIEFTSSTGERVKFEADLPEELEKILDFNEG
ncbi:MAG: RluA family pseudouridine synthase [bacterium]|nr:RluA family pseudouridine synthase [bacterium]